MISIMSALGPCVGSLVACALYVGSMFTSSSTLQRGAPKISHVLSHVCNSLVMKSLLIMDTGAMVTKNTAPPIHSLLYYL